MQTENKIMYFHIGRGGRYNNQGHVTFGGQKNIGEVLSIADGSGQHTYFSNRDSSGKFITPTYFDHNGNEIITEKQVNTGVGCLNWDNDYDSDICLRLKDCTENQLLHIHTSNEWIDDDVRDYVERQLNDCAFLFFI